MPLKIIADHDKPSVAIEIPLEKSLPDYDLEDLEHPTPRDVDGVLVSQGFRDLVDDTRGVLLEILCARHKSMAEESNHLTEMELTPETPHPMEITQLTGAICTQEESYRPGLWIPEPRMRPEPPPVSRSARLSVTEAPELADYAQLCA